MPPRFLFALLLSFAVGAAAPLAPARANCFENCQSSCKDLSGNISGSCVDTCNRYTCERPTISYGAIAYGAQSRAFGYSNDFRDSAGADQFALKNCAKHGDDCKVVASFLNKCAAVAAGNKDAFATGEGLTRNQAEAQALAACKGKSGIPCEIQAWSCALP